MVSKAAENVGRLSAHRPLETLLKRKRTHFLYLHNVPDLEWFQTVVLELRSQFELISYDEATNRVRTNRHPRPAICFSFDDGFESSGQAAEIVAASGATTCLFICPEIVGATRPEQDRLFGRPQAEPTMSWARLAELHRAGHSIGSHSMRHADLSQLDTTSLRHDITTSRAEIIANVGDCAHFAWPLGRARHSTPDVLEFARMAGFTSVASAVRGSHGRGSTPALVILRHVVQPGQSIQSILGHLVLADVGLDPHRSDRAAVNRLATTSSNSPTTCKAAVTSMTCPVCNRSGRQRLIIEKFRTSDHGHVWCGRCRASYDSDAMEMRDAIVDQDRISSIGDREDYRKLFVETWEIADRSGEVYTAFDWDDNSALQQGVAGHIIRSIDSARGAAADAPAVLDVGCGNGFTTKILADRFGADAITGLDPSPLIEELESLTGVRGVRGTLDSVSFDDGQFDVVVIVGNLMLHPDPQATLDEVHRILKADGIVVFDFKNIGSAPRVITRQIARRSKRAARHRLVQRNFLNMRYGYTRRHVPIIAPPSKFTIVQVYDKPARLLEFSNKSEFQSGVAGILWRLLNKADSVRHQQAWIQVTARKKPCAGPG